MPPPAHHQEQTVSVPPTRGFSPAVADVSKSVGPVKVATHNALVAAVVTVKTMMKLEVDLLMLTWHFVVVVVVVVCGTGSVVIEDLFVV